MKQIAEWTIDAIGLFWDILIVGYHLLIGGL